MSTLFTSASSTFPYSYSLSPSELGYTISNTTPALGVGSSESIFSSGDVKKGLSGGFEGVVSDGTVDVFLGFEVGQVWHRCGFWGDGTGSLRCTEGLVSTSVYDMVSVAATKKLKLYFE